MPSDMVMWRTGRWLRRLPATTHIYEGCGYAVSVHSRPAT
jgi:hypothetical protein